MEVDPDYAGFTIAPQENLEEDERSKILQENAREATVKKIKNIINEQFDKEIEIKENELMRINQKLADARCAMDRLRACVVASFYANSFTKPVDGAKGPEAGAAYHPAIQNVMRKAVTAVMSKNAPYKQQTRKPHITVAENDEMSGQDDISAVNESAHDQTQDHSQSTLDLISKATEAPVKEKIRETENGNKHTANVGVRQRIKKTIIVGNVSKYIPSDQREASDKSTHKWMVYVRGSKEEPRIDHFVRKVWFFLHPSYRPNDLVEVCEAPFHLTRRGWGEFPIRVQIHFCDRRNRPVDIIHGLRLDRTYTGLQTLGAETVCEVELDRSSVQISVDDILEVSNLPNLTPNDDSTHTEETLTDPPNEQNEEHTKENTPDDITEESTQIPVKEATGENAAAEVEQNDVPSTTGSPSRKRKLDEGCEVEEISEENENKPSNANSDCLPTGEELLDEPPPFKRKRKRRRDGCRTSASEDEVLSDAVASATSAEDTDQEQNCMPAVEQVSTTQSIAISDTVDDSPNKEDADETKVKNNESSPMEIDQTGGKESPMTSRQESVDDSSQSSDSSVNVKQPVVVLPRSPISGAGFFRMRSASDGEGFPRRSASSVLKPGVGLSSVVNISVNPDQPNTSTPEMTSSGTTPVRKVTVLSPKSVIFQSKGTSSQPIVLSTLASPTVKTSESNPEGPKSIMLLKKEPSESTGHITIPLSSLLRTGAGISQPQVVKLAQPTVSSGQTFAVDMLSLGNQKMASKREKRSFSADHSPVRTLSLAPAASSSATQQPIQLHILSPQTKSSPKRSKPAGQPVTLHTLQAALSSGNVTLCQPQPKKQDDSQQASKVASGASQQQFVLTTLVNQKGKQHLALINPSTLSLGSTKKVITITSTKVAKKTTMNITKQPPPLKPVANKPAKPAESGTPSQKDRTPTTTKSEPIHKVLGDRFLLDRKAQSFEEDILPLLVKMVPLINEKRDQACFPFCAKMEADFLEWNVGKQRASEWQRACLMQKVLKYIQGKNEHLQKCAIPSKKFIMNWCLRHGHSVFTDEYEDDAEDGINDNVSTSHPTPTMTSTDEILKLLDKKKNEQTKENKLTNEGDDDVIFIDVVNVESPTVKMEDVKQEPSEGVVTSPEKDNAYNQVKARIQTFIESPEVSAVEEMTREIDVNLHRMYGMPACHLVLAKAFQQFTESLLRKSLSCALERRDGPTIQRVAPEEIKLCDVVGAIRGTSAFDFLTDCNTACDSPP